MRLLLISRYFPPDQQTGAAVTFSEFYQQARLHANVRLIAGWSRARSLVPPEAVAVELKQGSFLSKRIRLHRSIQLEIRKWKPDVVITNGFIHPSSTIPSLVLVSEEYSHRSIKNRIPRLLQNAFFPKRCKIFCPNDVLSQRLLSNGIPRSSIQLTRFGIDTLFYQQKPLPTSDQIQIVCPVRIRPDKEIEHLINAIASLRKKEKERIQVHIVGRVEQAVYADKLRIQAYGHPIQFHTDVKDMRPFLQLAHLVVYLHQSKSHLHRTAMEAMSTGRPVLWAGNEPAHALMSQTGITCSGSSAAIQEKISWAISNPSTLSDLGTSSRQLIEENYDWTVLWKTHQQTLKELLSS